MNKRQAKLVFTFLLPKPNQIVQVKLIDQPIVEYYDRHSASCFE